MNCGFQLFFQSNRLTVQLLWLCGGLQLFPWQQNESCEQVFCLVIMFCWCELGGHCTPRRGKPHHCRRLQQVGVVTPHHCLGSAVWTRSCDRKQTEFWYCWGQRWRWACYHGWLPVTSLQHWKCKHQTRQHVWQGRRRRMTGQFLLDVQSSFIQTCIQGLLSFNIKLWKRKLSANM